MYNNKTQQSRPTDHHLSDTSATDYYRSDRLFTRSSLWYFHTKEGKDVGPFRYRDEAELMLTKFVQELQKAQDEALVSTKPHFRLSGVVGRRQPG